MRLEPAADSEAAASRAAELIAAAGRRAIAERGSFKLAVSGGRTPWKMLEELAGLELEWERTALFQVDERVAPSGSRERNLTHLILSLPLRCQGAIRPMPVGSDDLEAAAERYAESLPERFDLIHLGLGPDGHTASLVPEDPILDLREARVALTAGQYQGSRRMSLTLPAIDAAREVIFLVDGQSKRVALGRLLDGDRGIPAGRVEAAEMTVVADRDALGDRA